MKKPMTTDFRALCAELVDELNYHADEHSVDKLIARARTALAAPPPEPPTDKELNALWNRCGTADDNGNYYEGNIFKFARSVLEFQRIIN